jgi:hypothetical protein
VEVAALPPVADPESQTEPNQKYVASLQQVSLPLSSSLCGVSAQLVLAAISVHALELEVH